MVLPPRRHGPGGPGFAGYGFEALRRQIHEPTGLDIHRLRLG